MTKYGRSRKCGKTERMLEQDHSFAARRHRQIWNRLGGKEQQKYVYCPPEVRLAGLKPRPCFTVFGSYHFILD
jgi:hypothetical protein